MENVENVHEVMPSRTPPRRKFGAHISENTPPPSESRRDRGKLIETKGLHEGKGLHAVIDQAAAHGSSDGSARTHYIDSLLPGSLHIYSSLPSPPQVPTTPTVDFHSTPSTSTACPPSMSTPTAFVTTKSFSNHTTLSPSILRKMTPYSVKQGTSAKPRYSVLLQVLKSMSVGQNNHPVGANLIERLSAAALGTSTHHKHLSTTLACKTKLLLELSEAVSSERCYRPDVVLTESKAHHPSTLCSEAQLHGTSPATDALRLMQQSALKTSQTSLVESTAPVRQTPELKSITRHDTEMLLAKSVTDEAQLLEARNEIAELQKRLRSISLTERNRTRENESLRKENLELSSQISRLRNALDDKENQLLAKSTEFIQCKGSLEDVKAELFQRKEELHFALRSNDKLKTKLSAATSKLEIAAKQSRSDVDDLTTQNNELKQEILDLEGSLTELDRMVRSMRSNLTESEARITEMREHLSRERKATMEAQQYAQEMQATMDKRLSEALAQLSHEKSAKVSASADNDMMKAKVASLTAKIRAHEQEIMDLRKQFDNAETGARLENQGLVARLEAEIKKNRTVVDELSAANLASARTKRELDSVLIQSEERLEQYRLEMNSRIEKQSETIAEQEKEIESLKQISSFLREGNNLAIQLKDSLVNARCEISQLEDCIKELQDEQAVKVEGLNRDHRIEIEKVRADFQLLESACKSYEEKWDAAQEKLTSVEIELQTFRREKERLLAENEELRSELHQAKDLVQELRWEVDALDRDGCTSDDSSDGQFSNLTKYDLKVRCSTQLDEIDRLQTGLLNRASECESLTKRVVNADSDMNLLSEELSKLVQTNGKLELSLTDCRRSLEAAGLRESSLQAALSSMEEASTAMENELKQRTDTIQSLRKAAQRLTQQVSDQSSIQNDKSNGMEVQIKRLISENEDLSSQARRAYDEMEKMKSDLLGATNEAIQLRTRLSLAEEELSAATSRLEESTRELELIQSSSGNEAQMDTTIHSLQTECSSLRIERDSLKGDLEVTRRALDVQERREHELEEKLAFQQKSLIESDSYRELFESKYSHASQLLVTQNEKIRTLEAHVEEGNRSVKSLSAQVNALQVTVKQAEESTALLDENYARQLRVLEEKLSQLEDERSQARQEVNQLKDELRECRRRSTELEKENGQAQSRLESLRKTLSDCKADLARERNHSDEGRAALAAMKVEMDYDKSEIQHLKARTQLLDTSLARLKSENTLAMEASRATEEGLRNELDNLRLEIETKTRKLTSLSEIYHAQNDALKQFRLSEKNRLAQLHEAINEADETLRNVVSSSCGMEDSRALYALDLARHTFGSGKVAVLDVDVWTTWTRFKERLTQSGPTKDRSLDGATVTSSLTPPKILSRTSIPETPDIKDALENVKRFFRDELLSPDKCRSIEPTQEKMIQSLECQIDTLLFDLKAANDALRANTQFYSDLEELVKHREQERDKLGLQVERRTAVIRELERRLERELTSKQDLEKQVDQLQQDAERLQQGSQEFVNVNTVQSKKRDAGRKIAVFLQEQERRTRASYFSRWACHVAVMKAAEQQNDLANQLADELKTTREKVSLLKKHLKNKSRGRDSVLEVISEDSEQIDI